MLIAGAIGFVVGLVNGGDVGNVEGVMTGLVIDAVGAEVEGVGSGYVTGAGEMEGFTIEGPVIGVGRGFKEGIVMVGFVEGTMMIIGVGFVDGTVIGLVT
ncbi:hypothetical protein E2562_033755 [Oryza meyeriana var. granulata]|uniref:Uncharacterized protein n=1 Tax=Oryza meyeriana var. granulata TaxID=110450 RepID=A0A6G1F143_9ORYZ|nr:hypothetical protein E2562_033755 [Oryza meyeriana var. granulata]